MEFLGVKLGIPPEFFLAHCEEYFSLSVVDKACTRETSSTHWKVSLPQKRQLPVGFQGPCGNYVIEAGNVSRLEINVAEDSRWITFSSQVSYWGKRYGQDSWTAVLLVDPYKVHLRLKHPGPTDFNTIINLDDFKPRRNLCTEVVVGSTSEKRTQPYERSIFDAMVNAHRHSDVKDTEDPFSATAYARNFIRATWEEEIWWNQMEFHDKVFEDEMQHRVYAQHNSLDSWTGKGEKGVEEYQKLIGERQSLKRMRNSLRGILWSFRCKDPEFLERQERNQEKSQEKSQEKIQEIEFKELIRRENKMWLFLDEKLEVMETTVSNHMEMYAQRAAMVESFAANRQARSASQLTKIATVIVPCTFVASIFSMGGEFAAGQSLFGVYWAVSIPATLVLLAWVLYGHNIPPAWGRVKGWVGRPKTVSSRNWQITLSKRH